MSKITYLSNEELQKICNLYNDNEALALSYLIDNNLCTDLQRKNAIRLLREAKLDSGLRDNKRYKKSLHNFFSQFGFKFESYTGEMYFEEKTFTVIREYYKTAEVKANTPEEALRIALRDDQDVFENNTLSYLRTYVDGTEIED